MNTIFESYTFEIHILQRKFRDNVYISKKINKQKNYHVFIQNTKFTRFICVADINTGTEFNTCQINWNTYVDGYL